MSVSSKRLLVSHAGMNSRLICIDVEPETTPRELIGRYLRKLGMTDESVFQDGRANNLVGRLSLNQFYPISMCVTILLSSLLNLTPVVEKCCLTAESQVRTLWGGSL